MSIEISKIERELETWSSKTIRMVIIGIGNPLRKDDAVGLEVLGSLQANHSDSVLLIESETVPENFIEPIITFNPSHLLIIDAALMGLEPGSVQLMEQIMTRSRPISTHALPLSLFSDHIRDRIGAKVALLAIQPENTDFGEGLTKELKKTVRSLNKILEKILSNIK